VRFSTKSFGVDAACVAAEALRAVAGSLEHADMSDIIAGRPVSSSSSRQALHVTAWQHTALLLVHAANDHGAPAELVASCALLQSCGVHSCLPHKCLHHLLACLQEDEALEALRLVAAALATAKLRHLNLSDNALGEKGVRAAAAALQPVSGAWGLDSCCLEACLQCGQLQLAVGLAVAVAVR
jgi:large subunit ribosomal protein L31/Ran GTPase-activating protein 1